MFLHFPKKFPTKKKFLDFPENFFSRGTFPEKFPPGIFGGPLGKFPEIPEIPGNSPKISGVFVGFPAVNACYPRKIRGIFPRKMGPPEKIPGISGKMSPRKFPEIPGNSPKFSPEFPGGSPRGSLGRLRLESRIFRAKFGRNLVKFGHFSGNCVPRKFPKMTKISGNFPEKWPFFGGLGFIGYWFPEMDPPKNRGKKKSVQKKSDGFFLFLRFFEKNVFFLSFRFGTQGRPSKFPDFFSEKSTKK